MLKSKRLQDIGPFEKLAAVAEANGVGITLYGGSASRAAMLESYRSDDSFDIFDLAPFSSDIDIEHSGTGEQTPKILAAIEELVPFASWFRWSVIDRELAAKAAAQRAISTSVPLRQIRFSTDRDPEIPDDALSDIEQRRVSFSRNPKYRADGEQRDVELYGLMMALNVHSEMGEISSDEISIDREAVSMWLDLDKHNELAQAAENRRLAARCWHLLSMRIARSGVEDRLTEELVRSAGTSGILDGFGVDGEALLDPNRAVSVSKVTGTGDFRVPELTPQIETGEQARESFGHLIRELAEIAHFPQEELPADPIDLVDPSIELIGLVPRLTLLPYSSSAESESNDETDVFYSGMEQEFVQIAWDNGAGIDLDDKGLTAQVIPWTSLSGIYSTDSLPAVGGVFGENRPWVRARLDDLIDRNSHGVEGNASLMIFRAKPGDSFR